MGCSLQICTHRAVYLLILSSLCSTLADTNLISNSWIQTALPANPPSGRYSHTAVYNCINKTMVVFGGKGSGSNIYNDINTYSLDMDVWTTPLKPAAGTPPPVRYGHSAVATPLNQMIIFGGRNATNFLNDIAVYDFLSNKWLPVNCTGSTPPPLAYHTAVVDPYQNSMFVYGGMDLSGAYYNKVYELKLGNLGLGNYTLPWSVVTPTPNGTAAVARGSHTAVVNPQGVMIVFGGIGNAVSQDAAGVALSDIACFNLRTKTWSSCLAAPVPAPSVRSGHTAVISPLQMMVIFGGKDSDGPVNSVWNFDLGLYKWVTVSPAGGPIEARSYHSAIATPFGSMVIFGGIGADSVYETDLGFYNLASTILRSENDGAVLVVIITLLGTILLSLCFAMDYMQELSEQEKEEAIERAKQEALLLPKIPQIPKALHVPLGPRAQKFFDEFKTSLDPLRDPL